MRLIAIGLVAALAGASVGMIVWVIMTAIADAKHKHRINKHIRKLKELKNEKEK